MSNNTDSLVQLIIDHLRKKIDTKFAFVHYKYVTDRIEIIERHNRYTRYKCILCFNEDHITIINAKLGTKHKKNIIPICSSRFFTKYYKLYKLYHA